MKTRMLQYSRHRRHILCVFLIGLALILIQVSGTYAARPDDPLLDPVTPQAARRAALTTANLPPNAPSTPTPADGATDVATSATLSWSGGDPDGDAVTHTVAFGDANPPPVVDSSVTTTSYNPGTLITSTTYYWQITATDGISITAGPLWSFTTTAGGTSETAIYLPLVLRGYSVGDTTSPTITGVTPADGGTEVATNTALVVDFSEAMDTGSANVSITPNVAFTHAWSDGDTRLTLSHAGLTANTLYAVTINAASDVAGNPLSGLPYSWSFTTQSSATIPNCLTAEEATLVSLVNAYRTENGIPAVPASKSLSDVAHWHVLDLETNNPDSGSDPAGHGTCNLHSWSDWQPGLWNAVCYTSDHYYAQEIWDKPDQITGGVYHWSGYENAARAGVQITAQVALNGWKNSPAHNAMILEQGMWSGKNWPAMGVGIYKGYAVLWFGDGSDPQGSISQCP